MQAWINVRPVLTWGKSTHFSINIPLSNTYVLFNATTFVYSVCNEILLGKIDEDISLTQQGMEAALSEAGAQELLQVMGAVSIPDAGGLDMS